MCILKHEHTPIPTSASKLLIMYNAMIKHVRSQDKITEDKLYQRLGDSQRNHTVSYRVKSFTMPYNHVNGSTGKYKGQRASDLAYRQSLNLVITGR